MKKYTKYVIETLLFGAVGVAAIVLSILFGLAHYWFFMVLAVLAVVVAWDNFFCGTRLSKAGKTCKTHYALPPFLKKR